MLKKYQPERTDLLINTDWGIARDSLGMEEARERNLLLFYERWVTKEEKMQLKDERNAYASIRVIGYLVLFVSVPVFVNIRLIAEGGISAVALAVIYALVSAVTGSGLIRYARYARYPAILIFLFFFILPFMPLFESEKGAPLLFILGAVGLYYLLRRTARKILWPETQAKPAGKNSRPFVRGIIITMALLVGLMAGYFIYDLNQASQMTADACLRATPGMPLEEFLSKFSREDYKIIQSTDHVLVVPKRGMGRNHCTVSHDEQKIIGSKTGFND